MIGACAVIAAAVIGLQDHSSPTINVFTGSSSSVPSPTSTHPAQSSPAAASSTANTAGHSDATGTITWPLNHATDVKHASPLHASGTVKNLQPGHQVLLFLNFADENLYYGGDPSPPITVTNGNWSEIIFIGGDRRPGQQFKLYLVDLRPQDRKLVDNQANPEWNSGFPPSIVWGPGEQVLASVTFTTD
jgi:hypothetical protein